jgi:hypothetical protein
MAEPERSLPGLQAEITAKAIAGVELLLEDAIDSWERAIANSTATSSRAAVLAGRLERARELASEIRALALQMAELGH